MTNSILNQFCIIRCKDAGVHMGVVKAINGRSVLLHDARRLWSWTERFTLNEVANKGAGPDSRISEPVAEIMLLEACEVILVDKVAIQNLQHTRNN